MYFRNAERIHSWMLRLCNPEPTCMILKKNKNLNYLVLAFTMYIKPIFYRKENLENIKILNYKKNVCLNF